MKTISLGNKISSIKKSIGQKFNQMKPLGTKVLLGTLPLALSYAASHLFKDNPELSSANDFALRAFQQYQSMN